MSARENILKQIAANKPPLRPSPELPSQPADVERFVKIQKFTTVLESIGGKVHHVHDLEIIKPVLANLLNKDHIVACLCAEIGRGNINISTAQTAITLEKIDTAIVAASYGIAENGSVWLYESAFINRLLPFICQHLIIVLNADDLLSDMHEAYSIIQVNKEGFGLFLAGPSKTADIEQSLVIGAHGARTTTVYLIDRQIKTSK